jgi:type VI secretion system secreted protein VgrG
MPEKYLEENRYLYVESGLGANELLLESFTGSEGISRLFSFQLELLSENHRISFERILGQPISFGVSGSEGDEPRCFHGVVTSFAQLPDTARLARYRAVVSPRLWTLTRKQNCRIFQGQSATDIISTVLQGVDFTLELQGSPDTREYCVQYRETDFDFISRLMEEEGLFYFFRFERGAHKLVVADSPAAHRDMPGGKTLLYEYSSGGLREAGRVSDWVKTQQLGSGKYSLTDYCYGSPSAGMDVNESTAGSVQVGRITHDLKAGGDSRLEVYDYPGRYGLRAQAGTGSERRIGQNYARAGIEQMEAAQFVIRGESNIFSLTPGYRFALSRHPNADGDYVLTAATHSASEGGFHSAAEIGRNHYSNLFECLPAETPFRPARVSPKPHVYGCQTAVVVGPSGEEIYVDDAGRIKVQFHWDRLGKNDASSSCWIRVASFWAGKAWGAVHLPRIGQEVVVDFLEGDPDCPIVVGSVYNGANRPPYDLPANKTQSGVKSRSSKGGGPSNYNEIRFEDKMGAEMVTVHAERDLETEVEHDERRHVMHDCNTTVDHDDTLKVGNNQTITIMVNRDAKTIGNDTETVNGNKSVTVLGSESRRVTSRTTTLGGADTLSAAGSVSVTAPSVTISASQVTIASPIVMVAGVVQCATLIATSVVSPSYTPGAGNVL